MISLYSHKIVHIGSQKASGSRAKKRLETADLYNYIKFQKIFFSLLNHFRVFVTFNKTPKPVQNLPDWKKSVWLNYFKTNRPYFWFNNDLKKSNTEDHGIKPEEEEAPWVNGDQGG